MARTVNTLDLRMIAAAARRLRAAGWRWHDAEDASMEGWLALDRARRTGLPPRLRDSGRRRTADDREQANRRQQPHDAAFRAVPLSNSSRNGSTPSMNACGSSDARRASILLVAKTMRYWRT